MGWKTVKARYQIGHIVFMRAGNLCIGSPYYPERIKVSISGAILNPSESYSNPDLDRYVKEFAADPQNLADAIAAEDIFERSIPVYTYDEEKGVVEKFCEERGWPNITHDGELMHENTFFESREEAIADGIKGEQGAIDFYTDRIRALNKNLSEVELFRARAEARLAELRSLPST